MGPKGGTASFRRRLDIDGAAHLVLRSGATPLHPKEAAFAAMLEGWEVQQRSRRLAPGTIDHGRRLVRRFFSFTGEYPWQWQPRDMEDWTVSMLSGDDPISHVTTRNYQLAIRTFMDYLCDPRYGWAEECLARFGTHPIQICHEGNTVKHLAEFEGEPGNRPFSRQELQAFFDHADAQVERARQLGRKGGWPRSGTPLCSRSPMRGGCAGGRSPSWTSWTSGRTPPRPCCAATGC